MSACSEELNYPTFEMGRINLLDPFDPCLVDAHGIRSAPPSFIEYRLDGVEIPGAAGVALENLIQQGRRPTRSEAWAIVDASLAPKTRKETMGEPQPFEATIDAMIAKAQKPRFWINIKAMLVKKHADYGQSGVKPPELAQHISAVDGILVRESDKLARLRQLQSKGYMPKVAESIEDTALDLVGYAALLYVAIRHEQQQAASAPVPEINEVERYIRATLASPHASEATKEGVRRRWPSFGAHFDEPQATGGNL